MILLLSYIIVIIIAYPGVRFKLYRTVYQVKSEKRYI